MAYGMKVDTILLLLLRFTVRLNKRFDLHVRPKSAYTFYTSE